MVNEIKHTPIVGVAVDPRSYVNIFYILLSFPLGIFYFIFLVTCVSLGVGLAVIWVGIPILLLVLGGSWLLCKFERALAIFLLDESIHPSPAKGASAKTMRGFSNSARWSPCSS